MSKYVKINPGWWFEPSQKYESQLGLLFPIYGKIKFMFQTTNQNLLCKKCPSFGAQLSPAADPSVSGAPSTPAIIPAPVPSRPIPTFPGLIPMSCFKMSLPGYLMLFVPIFFFWCHHFCWFFASIQPPSVNSRPCYIRC